MNPPLMSRTVDIICPLMRRHAILNRENRLNSIHQRKGVRKKRKGQKDREKEKDGWTDVLTSIPGLQ